MSSNSYFSRQFARLPAGFAFFLAGLCLVLALKPDETEYAVRQELHIRKPRFVRIYSRPPGENAEKQTGRKFGEHLQNALQGGSVGIEFDMKPVKTKLKSFYEKVRKYFPAIRRFDERSGSEDPKLLTEELPKGKDRAFDEDLKPRFGDESEEDEKDFDEFDLNPRTKLLGDSNRFVERELERFAECWISENC